MVRHLCALVTVAFLLVAHCVEPGVAQSDSSLSRYFRYVSPRPGARFLPHHTTLIFHPTALLERQVDWREKITVEGARSGRHAGEWILSDGTSTWIFKPLRPFEPGELVTVSTKLRGEPWFVYTFLVSSMPQFL